MARVQLLGASLAMVACSQSVRWAEHRPERCRDIPSTLLPGVRVVHWVILAVVGLAVTSVALAAGTVRGY